MARFAAPLDGTIFVGFAAPAATYTAAVLAQTGILNLATSSPAGREVYGPAAAYPEIVILNAKLQNGKRATFMCLAANLSAAVVGLTGAACAGSTIVSVRSPRSRYRI
jgi:hypothetical protein